MLTLVFVGCSDAEIHIVSETSPEDKVKLIFMPNSVQAAAKELPCVHLQYHVEKVASSAQRDSRYKHPDILGAGSETR